MRGAAVQTIFIFSLLVVSGIFLNSNFARSAFGITETVYMDSSSFGATPQTVNASNPSSAEYVTPTSSLVNKTINEMTVWLGKAASPTGTLTAGIFDSSNNVKKSFGTLDVSTLSTTIAKKYVFLLPNGDSYTIQAGDYIGVKYTGGDATNYVKNWYDSTDSFDAGSAVRARYTTSWTTFSTNDLMMILSYDTSSQFVTPSFDKTKAYQYIVNQYNPSVGLVKETEAIDTYWLWTDNVLASEVLKDFDYQKSASITSAIKNYTSMYDLDYRHPQGVLFDNVAYFNGVTNKQIVGNIWYSDSDQTELECSDYGDIAFLKSIYYYRAGKLSESRTCYDMGASMFDGIGIKDKAFVSDGNRYSTYKLALWQIASNVTGYEIPKEPMAIMPFMQDETTGGVYTHYLPNLTPNSLTNVETTSLVIMAHTGINLKTEEEKSAELDNQNITMILVGSFAVVGFGVLLSKRLR